MPDSKNVINILSLIRSATLKAEDEGIKKGDDKVVEDCLRYIERRIADIRKDRS